MKNKTVFFCSECGNETAKWYGKCPACGAWNTLVEETVVTQSGKSSTKSANLALLSNSAPVKLKDISTENEIRNSTGMTELDRVLGGGLVTGSLILIGGDPGIGKSTLLLQICDSLAESGNVLYVSGEESERQLKMRASRLGIHSDDLSIVSQVNMDAVIKNIDDTSPSFVIIDSFQTMYAPEITAAPGSVSQVREVTMTLMRKAKENGITILVVGHVTKDGGIAGPKVLEHMVDCVLYFEGERHQNYRILRSVKNRFGSTNEIGVFEMRESGLVQVENPSVALLEGRPKNVAGTAVICAMEGSRPLLAEVQSLVASTSFAVPRRSANGVDHNRVSMLIAVLEKRVGMNMSTQDAYVNVIGGVRIDEPAADLGIVCSLASGFRNFVIPDDIALIGEVGLTGELRSVNHIEKRIAEIEKLGFKKCIIPKNNQTALKAFKTSVELIFSGSVIETLSYIRD